MLYHWHSVVKSLQCSIWVHQQLLIWINLDLSCLWCIVVPETNLQFYGVFLLVYLGNCIIYLALGIQTFLTSQKWWGISLKHRDALIAVRC